MIENWLTVRDFDKVLSTSHDKPVFLLKHSTRCPISAGRWRVFHGLAQRESRAQFCKLLVIESRALSRRVARKTGITHESPQVILFHKGKAVWDTSHTSITEEEITKALEQAMSL